MRQPDRSSPWGFARASRRAVAVLCLAAASVARLAADDAAPAPELPKVSSVRVEGTHAIAAEEAVKRVPLRAGQSLDAESAPAAARALQAYYRSQGFADAAVTAREEPEESGVAVVLVAREGERYTFGTARVEGLREMPERIARRNFAFKPGAAYDPRTLLDTQSNLYASGFFSEVGVKSSTSAARTADVVVTLKEKHYQWIEGGPGYGSEERQRFSLKYTDDNFLRRAYHFELSGLYSAIWLESDAQLIDKYLFGTDTQGRAETRWRHEDREGYQLEQLTGRVGVSRQLSKHLHIEPDYRLERTVTFRVDPGISPDTPAHALTSAGELHFNWDDTNDLLFPTSGARSTLSYERAGGFFGGDVNLNKVILTHASYAPIWKGLVGMGVLRAGWVESFQPSSGVPIFEKLFLGGARTLRGYRERFAGALDDQGNPAGGDRLLGATAELRFPIWKALGGAVFMDAGGLGGTWTEASPNRWKRTAGAGVRYKTPVGPFRLDYGYKLNPDPDDHSLWRLHLTLGESF